MTDLRDRIVASMKERAEQDTDWMLADLADAVIEALGLERENWHVDMGVTTLPRHMWVKPTPVHRYVTEWETDD